MSPEATLSFRPARSQPAGQEGGGVRVARVALDEDVVARGHLGDDRVCLGLADTDVVEGDVEDARILDEPVIRDDRDACVRGRLEGGTDGLVVLGQQDDDVGALLDEGVDVA